MKVVISHFYNEEYLLPWWLTHHKKYFDHGIMIDYSSTDKSRDVIKCHCPNWDIVQSKNTYFTPAEVDSEVKYYEDFLDKGTWKIALNTTEFLIGNYKALPENEQCIQHLIPCLYFVDTDFNRNNIDKDVPLWEQLFNGLNIERSMKARRSRSLHNHNGIFYTPGRHFDTITTNDFVIFNYGFSPMTREMKERKLQIQNKIPAINKLTGLADDHSNYGKGLTEESLFTFYKSFLDISEDVSDIMKYFLDKMEN